VSQLRIVNFFGTELVVLYNQSIIRLLTAQRQVRDGTRHHVLDLVLVLVLGYMESQVHTLLNVQVVDTRM